MGLRFRKSVKICNGLRLNFGKSGASITVGSGPFKKTFNTNGNVTTTVGLPGTGIYWTETEKSGSRNKEPSSRKNQEWISTPQSDYQVSPEVDNYFAQARIAENTNEATTSDPFVTIPAQSPLVETSPSIGSDTPSSIATSIANRMAADDIKNLYLYADAPVDWTELIAGATADDLLMDPFIHSYCAQMAPRILSGDLDAYLEAIEKMRPVDDLALYSGNFEFGTDNANYIEVEFSANPERVLHNEMSDDMLEEFVSAITIRIARDLLALLPISKVLAHVEINDTTVLSVLFDRNQLCKIDFRNETASTIIKKFNHLVVVNYSQLYDVGRLTV